MALVSLKDSRWLQLEVCREWQRNKCSRCDADCKFAHPPPHVDVQAGRVVACYDSIKGRCNREKPPCKYFHPPQHLKDQLLINGRNHLALKNALLQQLPLHPALQPALQPMATTSPYLPAMAAASTFSPYLSHAPMMAGLLPADALSSPLGLMPSPLVAAAQKMQRTDRLEVCREFQRGNCKRSEAECRFAHPPDAVEGGGGGGATGEGGVTVCMDFVKGRCSRDACRYFHPPAHLQAQLKAAQARPAAPASVSAATAALSMKTPWLAIGNYQAFPGLVPYAKRAAVDKSGLPVYQPSGAAAYQQALAMQVQQPFVPVTFAGHPATVPRF